MALSFVNSSDQYVDVDSFGAHYLTTSTITGRLRTTFSGDFSVIVSRNTDSSNRSFWIVVWDNGFSGQSTSGGGANGATSGGYLTWKCSTTVNADNLIHSNFRVDDGEWHSFALTAQVPGTVEMFVDGQKTDTISISGVLDDPDEPTRIGSESGSGSRFYEGDLEDIRLYNRILSDSEIQTIHALRGQDNIVEGGISRYILNEGSGIATGVSTIRDIWGGIDGNPINSPTYTSGEIEQARSPFKIR